MAQTAKKKTQSKAQGTTNNGRTGRQKLRRPHATAKFPRKREKAPSAKAARKKPAASSGNEDPNSMSGIEVLHGAVNLQLKTRSKALAESMMTKAIAGTPGATKTLIKFAEEHDAEKGENCQTRLLAGQIEQLADELEQQELAERKQEFNESAGDSDTPELVPVSA